MISGAQPCYRCGKPSTMAVNLNANAASGVPSNMVAACDDCHPTPLTVLQRENERLRSALTAFADHFGPLEDNHMLNDGARNCFKLAREALNRTE